jgi:hypothetical protein
MAELKAKFRRFILSQSGKGTLTTAMRLSLCQLTQDFLGWSPKRVFGHIFMISYTPVFVSTHWFLFYKPEKDIPV